MILFKNDWRKENASINYDTNNKSFLRIAMLYKKMGLENWAFPLTLKYGDLAKHDPHNLKDPSAELRALIAAECKLNPWYFFREVIRLPASGDLQGIPFEANRGNFAMIWCFFNNLHYLGIQPRQTGKEQPLNSKIITPDGYIYMRDIKVNDIVIAADGTPTKVVGVYPQGVKASYRVTFEDGRFTDCGIEHLWKIYKNDEYSIINTKDLINKLDTTKNISIPLRICNEGMNIPVLLDPYLVGSLLATENSRYKTLSLPITQDFVLKEFKDNLPEGIDIISIKNDIYNFINLSKEMNLPVCKQHRNKKTCDLILSVSHIKKIPEDYLHLSLSQTYDLLRGLFDLDGILDKKDETYPIYFNTPSYKLASQVQELVWKIGGICKLRQHNSDTVYRDTHGTKRTYELKILIQNPNTLFRHKYIKNIVKRPKDLTLRIKSISRIGSAEMQCIEVDHQDHLYVVDDYLVTHNTIGACSVIVHTIYIAGQNIEIMHYAQTSDLIQTNVSRIKSIRDKLPEYLLRPSGKDTDNKEGLSYEIFKNRFLTKVAQDSKEAADKTGRGMTSPVEWLDEPAFCANINISYPAMMKSTTAAVVNARRNGQPHSNILTTTAAPINTKSGEFTYRLVNESMPFSETIFDMENKEAVVALLKTNSANDMINGTFSYLMLGKDEAWLEDAIRKSSATKEQNDRELLNMWKSGVDTSLLDKELVQLINQHKHEPYFVEPIADYIIRWYLPRDTVSSPNFSNRRLILGMDSSEAIGRDFTTLVLLDIGSMEVVATFRCNEGNITKLGMFIAQFLIKYSNVTFIPERNSTGVSIIDTILIAFQKQRINPFRRIFNQIIQNYNLEDMRSINIDDIYSVSDSSIRKHFGFRTTGKTRPYLYKNTLNKAVSLNAKKLHDYTLINELSTLSVKNGRIDHEADSHDDMVIAYLLTCWLIFFGENLQFYGIDPKMIPTTVTYSGDIVDPVYRDQQLELRSEIQKYQKLIKETPYDSVKHSYIQKVAYLQTQLDPDMVIDPIGVAKVGDEVNKYGATIYTPQELFIQTQQQKTNQQNINNIFRLL